MTSEQPVSDKRPLPNIEAAVRDTCDQANSFLNKLSAVVDQIQVSSIGIKPCPQLFPNWEVHFRILPKS